MNAEVHVADVGTIFEATIRDQDGTVVDISAATTKQLLLRKPDGTLLTKVASLTTTGTDGKMQYTTVANDLDQPGLWRIQGYVVVGAGSWHTDIYDARVHPNVP